MNQSEREVLVGEFLDQPFDQQHSAEHVGSRCQDSTANLDDVIASVYSLLTAIQDIDDYDCGCSECACISTIHIRAYARIFFRIVLVFGFIGFSCIIEYEGVE